MEEVEKEGNREKERKKGDEGKHCEKDGKWGGGRGEKARKSIKREIGWKNGKREKNK